MIELQKVDKAYVQLHANANGKVEELLRNKQSIVRRKDTKVSVCVLKKDKS